MHNAQQAILSSSLDGTVRAHDLLRYRNFRTLTTPSPTQLLSLAVDPAGEVVCAGSAEPFEVNVYVCVFVCVCVCVRVCGGGVRVCVLVICSCCSPSLSAPQERLCNKHNA